VATAEDLQCVIDLVAGRITGNEIPVIAEASMDLARKNDSHSLRKN
jgi:hypothetical protein